jgi:hypothetical protein
MMLNLAFTSLCKLNQDKFSLHSTVNLHITRFNKLDENMLKYNKQHDVKIMSFNIIDDDAEITLNFVNLIINTSDNSTISTDFLEASNHIFVD